MIEAGFLLADFAGIGTNVPHAGVPRVFTHFTTCLLSALYEVDLHKHQQISFRIQDQLILNRPIGC